MPEYPLTVNLKLLLVIDADDDTDLAQTVTDEVVNALQQVTVFSRAMVRPGSTFHHADGRPVHNGEPAGGNAPTARPPDRPAAVRDNARLLGRDLEITAIPGGQYEISLAGHGRICKAPSNHPEWLNAIADAINAGRQLA